MKSIFAISNDWHLKTGTEEQTLRSIKHMISELKKKGIADLVLAGDLFDSRSFQRQDTLLTLDLILGLFFKAGITVYLFPGNHDKSVYSSNDSFLRPYRFHPGVKFFEQPELVTIKGVSIFLVPFFSEEILVKVLKEGPSADLLISHFDLNGSSYLNHVVSGKKISVKDLKKWKKTYLGHFHDLFEVTKNIVHLPSLYQSQFGENSNKGFTVIYEDLSYEVIKGVFKEFTKLVVDLDVLSNKQVADLVKKHSNSEDIIRFELVGSDERIRAVDKKQFSKAGIDFKAKFKEVTDQENLEMPKVTEVYSVEDIEQDLKVFCEDKDLDHEVGQKYLTKFLKDKEDNG